MWSRAVLGVLAALGSAFAVRARSGNRRTEPLLTCPGCNGGIGEDDCRRLQPDLDIQTAVSIDEDVRLEARQKFRADGGIGPPPDFSVECPHCDGRWLYFALTGEIEHDQRPTLEAGLSAAQRRSLLDRLPATVDDLGELRRDLGDLRWELAREFADWGGDGFDERALQLGSASWRAHWDGSPIDLGPVERLMAMVDVLGAAPIVALPPYDRHRSYMDAALRRLREQLGEGAADPPAG